MPQRSKSFRRYLNGSTGHLNRLSDVGLANAGFAGSSVHPVRDAVGDPEIEMRAASVDHDLIEAPEFLCGPAISHQRTSAQRKSPNTNAPASTWSTAQPFGPAALVGDGVPGCPVRRIADDGDGDGAANCPGNVLMGHQRHGATP